MQPKTFSRRDIAVWQQESPSLQGGEDVKVIEGVSLVNSAGVEESASLIEVMARDAQEGLGYEIALRGGKPKDLGILAQFAIEGLPGCGPGTARKLLAHFGSVQAVLSASVDQLCEVKGVGRKTADQIRELLSFQVR